MKVLFGQKIGMTQIFQEDGKSLGVTAVEIWPATVIKLKTADKDGYEAMQVGAGTAKNVGKSVLGQTGGTAYKVVAEFPKSAEDVAPGAKLGIDQLATGDKLKVSATSKGKGFQGTVKRYNFSRGPKTHGSRNYRAPGSIGGTDAARVFPGQKMPGRMGAEKVTQRNVEVAAVHPDEGVVLLKGSVPGPTGSTVLMRAE